jgi:UDPglucose--hexose-1-phosphate uridylyltransferase
MAALDLQKDPHRRFNALTGEWVLVSPHRTARPWLGQVENVPVETMPAYDPSCYMCPGNKRATGAQNPVYERTLVFDNDYPALFHDGVRRQDFVQNDLLVANGEYGICRVVCFSPRHDLTVSLMSLPDLEHVVNVWAGQYRELGALPFVNYVQIFENRGAMMGASNPHPHGQIWASSNMPNEPSKEQARKQQYRADHGSCLLCDYLKLEREVTDRLVCENQHFSVVIPFWAIWPFETLILPHRHMGAISDLSRDECAGLADILKRLTMGYDSLFHVPFPYSMGFHQRPTDGESHTEWHTHIHFYPPLLRSSTIRKFMVGYEMLGTPQRDITAETAATCLREVTPRGDLA